MHDLQRFIDRIWKRIYRKNYCFKHLKTCKDCSTQKESWFIITDESHAFWLLDAQNEIGYIYHETQ